MRGLIARVAVMSCLICGRSLDKWHIGKVYFLGNVSLNDFGK
jgi:hypothetical protein